MEILSQAIGFIALFLVELVFQAIAEGMTYLIGDCSRAIYKKYHFRRKKKVPPSKERNLPCPCGSGKKAKACHCGQSRNLLDELKETWKKSNLLETHFMQAALWITGGLITGILTLSIMPYPLFQEEWQKITNLVTTPLLVGFAMGKLGAWRRNHGKETIHLATFAYGYLFALAMAIARYGWANLVP